MLREGTMKPVWSKSVLIPVICLGLIRLGMSVISAEVYGAVVFMVVSNTLVTPLLLRIAFRNPIPEPALAQT